MDFLHNHEQNENKQCTPEEEYKQEWLNGMHQTEYKSIYSPSFAIAA
mgnify:CR=1 FL=1